ncbi:MAG: hypothetical protein AB1689_13675 [Thermodesulfobacteriota bacterium]
MAATNGTGPTNGAGDEDLQVGDLVVIMAEPGPFTVVDVDGRYVTIASANGVQRKVRDIAVRRVSAEPPVAR